MAPSRQRMLNYVLLTDSCATSAGVGAVGKVK
jgi:hypothetical protein